MTMNPTTSKSYEIIMRKLAVTLGFVAGLTLWQAAAADAKWHTDLEKAQAVAKAEKKMVLLDFTGSDW